MAECGHCANCKRKNQVRKDIGKIEKVIYEREIPDIDWLKKRLYDDTQEMYEKMKQGYNPGYGIYSELKGFEEDDKDDINRAIRKAKELLTMLKNKKASIPSCSKFDGGN